MREQLLEIEKQARDLDLSAIGRLKKAATNSEVRVAFEGIPFFSNIIETPIQELFEWHNGTETNSYEPATTFYLLADYFILSIEEIKQLASVLDFTENKMFPFCSSGQGEYLTLDATSKETLLDGFVYKKNYIPGLNRYEPLYQNIYKMLETILECYKQGAYYKENDTTFNLDEEKEKQIAKRFNPLINYWSSL